MSAKRHIGEIEPGLETRLRLHRYHMHQQATRLEFDHPYCQMAWRCENTLTSGTRELVAYRLALCWNLLEGFPTEALEGGILRELCTAVDDGDLARAKRELAKLDRGYDNSKGRGNDCGSCAPSRKKKSRG